MQLFAPEPDELEGTARVARTGEAILYRTVSEEAAGRVVFPDVADLRPSCPS